MSRKQYKLIHINVKKLLLAFKICKNKIMGYRVSQLGFYITYDDCVYSEVKIKPLIWFNDLIIPHHKILFS